MKRLALLATIALVCLVSAQASLGAPVEQDATSSSALTATGVLVLQQGENGYTGNSNATLDAWYPDTNAASPTGAISLRTYVTNGVARFDLTALPSNAYVTRATLRYYVIDRTNASNVTLRFYRLLRPWATQQVTWHEAASGELWEKPGANDVYIDRSGALAASVVISTATGFYDVDVTTLVRDWVHRPATNFGALIVPAGDASVQYRLAADTFMVAGSRPRLTIEYSIDASNDFPPAITLTNPAHNSFQTGTVHLTVNVDDDRGVQWVRYYLDGALLAQVWSPPYDYWLDTSGLAVGRHGLTARVSDNNGVTRDDAITFNVYRLAQGILTFGHISDAHLGTQWEGTPPDPALYLARFQQAIAEFRDVIQPAVIINTGDSTNVADTYSLGLYTTAIDATRIPVMPIPGNHDLANRENYLNNVGKTKYSFDVDRYRFAAFTANELDAGWLNTVLASTANKAIVFGHYVLRLPAGSTDPVWFYSLPTSEAAALRQTMSANGALAYLSGHYHSPYVFEDEISHVTAIGAPAVGQKSSYIISTIDQDVVSSIVHYLGNWPEVVVTYPQQFYADGGSKTISGTVPIRARLFGTQPIISVRYAIDGVARGEMTALGDNVWQAEWDTQSLPFGEHTISVTASDSANRTRSSSIRVRTVEGSAAPRTPTNTPTVTQTPTITLTPTTTPTPTPYVQRVNCGGGAYVDSAGRSWSADRPFDLGPWGYDGATASVGVTANAIAGASDPTLYQTDRRWDNSETVARYRFSVPYGRYRVVLHFAETEATQAGQRVFSVRSEGTIVAENYDIYAAVGVNRATRYEFTVTVSDGILNLAFLPVTGRPKVNAIEVIDADSTLPEATATATATPTNVAPPTPSMTATQTRTSTPSPIATATATHTPTAAATATVTPTPVGNTATATATHSATPTAGGAPAYSRRVNAGGSDYVDTSGAVWSADKVYWQGSWGYVAGSAYAASAAIAGTDDDPLYQSERFGMTSYIFTVPNGVYQVDLLFAELYCTYKGCRVFDVQIEGKTVLSAFDIIAVAGRYTAVTRSFTATVNDGKLDIAFVARTASPKVNAIGVRSLP